MFFATNIFHEMIYLSLRYINMTTDKISKNTINIIKTEPVKENANTSINDTLSLDNKKNAAETVSTKEAEESEPLSFFSVTKYELHLKLGIDFMGTYSASGENVDYNGKVQDGQSITGELLNKSKLQFGLGYTFQFPRVQKKYQKDPFEFFTIFVSTKYNMPEKKGLYGTMHLGYNKFYGTNVFESDHGTYGTHLKNGPYLGIGIGQKVPGWFIYDRE